MSLFQVCQPRHTDRYMLIKIPDVWRPLPDWLGGEQPYDLNSWQESETALALADTLDEDAVIVEGYAEYATWRPHLAYLRDPYGDPDMEMEIDGVGGVSILAKAKVFRAGVHFPAFSFEKHAETEGFGKVCQLWSCCMSCLLTCTDGQTDAVFGHWTSSLHNLAFVRAQCRRYQTHGGKFFLEMVSSCLTRSRKWRMNGKLERKRRKKKLNG